MRPRFLDLEVTEAAEDAGILKLQTSGFSAIPLG